MNRPWRHAISFVLLTAFVVPAFSADEFNCGDAQTPDSMHFADIQKQAQQINQQFCDALKAPASSALPREELRVFAARAHRDVLSRFAGLPLDQLDAQFTFWEGQIDGGSINPLSMPVLIVARRTPNDPYRYSFAGNADNNAGVISLASDDTACASAFNGDSCSGVLEDLANAIAPYQINYNAYAANRTVAELNRQSKRWDRYFEEGRSLTTIDLALTTWMEKESIRASHLQGPPPRQWFALHPEPVVEYIPGAPSGDQFEAALAVEWVGVNWWEDSIIGLPFGASFSTTHSERIGVDDMGYGVTLYFDNVYSVGWARHGDEDGYYVSLDLLTLFEEQKSRIERYRSAVGKVD